MPDLRNIDAFADVTGPQPDHTHDSGELPRSTAGVSPEEAGGEYRCSECHAALLYPHDPLCSKRRLTIDAVLHKDVETVASIQREADANRAHAHTTLLGFDVVLDERLKPGEFSLRPGAQNWGTFRALPPSLLLQVNDGKAAHLPDDAALRKGIPVATGFFDYFPDAIIAVATLSRIGNDQHNPGKPLHWDRSKSGDEADALARHFVDRGTYDTDGVRHSTKVAWRAMALLQKEIEADRAALDKGQG